jgi:hypothetical protein
MKEVSEQATRSLRMNRRARGTERLTNSGYRRSLGTGLVRHDKSGAKPKGRRYDAETYGRLRFVSFWARYLLASNQA